MIKKSRDIIIDCDPGHDDAIALVLAKAFPSLNILAICVEQGNQTMDKVGRNALYLASFLNIDAPVALGIDKPLKRKPITCPEIHGESGLDGFRFPPLSKYYSKYNAVELMKNIVEENPNPITIVGTGPLTNIATFLKKYPKLINKIEDIVIMGGSMGLGNVTPAAEFNIFADPEAADIIFKSGLPIHMMGLDVTRKVLVTPDVISRMEKINNPVSHMFVSLMKVFNENQKKYFNLDAAPLHDPVTIVYLLDPDSISTKFVNVDIDLTGGPSYGRTNVNIFGNLDLTPNAYVATDIIVKRYWDLVEEAIRHFDEVEVKTPQEPQ